MACGRGAVDPQTVSRVSDDSGLVFEVEREARRASDSLVWVGRIINESPAPVELRFGFCALDVRAWKVDTDGPVWRSEDRQSYPPVGIRYCPHQLTIATLEAGDSIRPREFRLTVPVMEILGDSLAEGLYRFRGRIQLINREVPWIPLGEATLKR